MSRVALALILLSVATSAHAEYPRNPSRTPAAAPAATSRTPAAVGAAAATTAAPAPAPPAEEAHPSLALGLRLGGNGNFAKVANDDSSSGFGYSLAVPIYVPISSQFRLTFAPGVQILSLTRTVDGTGQLIDPNPAEFTQTIRFLAASAYFGYNVTRAGTTAVHGTAFWIEGGFDFLYPFSATQTDNFDGDEKFTSNSKLLFAVLGVAGEYRLDPRVGFGCTLQAGYNLLAGSGTQLLTARFSLDVVLHL